MKAAQRLARISEIMESEISRRGGLYSESVRILPEEAEEIRRLSNLEDANRWGCRPDGARCRRHDRPRLCLHGCHKASAHQCKDRGTR